ncbi:MAG: fumarate hydratase C-terminal domain-containing protein, partial [Acidobacteriota bacterium]|nr:fumarate hydratase C-terminal domain-containing protein [Acidobacteriota bacterium]
MAHYDFHMPVTDEQVRRLRVNDTVTLNGTLFGIRDATQIHMFDRGRKTRFDLAGHAAIHTAPNVKKVEKSAAHPTGYAPVCIGTTTSDRMERF